MEMAGKTTVETPRIQVRLRSEETKGRLAVMENRIAADAAGPRLHVHPAFDEAFYVLEGELTFEVGGDRIVAPAGTLAFAPGETPHTYANLSGRPARVLLICTPAGFERYFDRLAAELAGEEPPVDDRPIPKATVVGPRIDRGS
jgi:quercetin dioxygenase-like cupin family protein